jgi:hypothetical protein
MRRNKQTGAVKIYDAKVHNSRKNKSGNSDAIQHQTRNPLPALRSKDYETCAEEGSECPHGAEDKYRPIKPGKSLEIHEHSSSHPC